MAGVMHAITSTTPVSADWPLVTHPAVGIHADVTIELGRPSAQVSRAIVAGCRAVMVPTDDRRRRLGKKAKKSLKVVNCWFYADR